MSRHSMLRTFDLSTIVAVLSTCLQWLTLMPSVCEVGSGL